MNGIANSPQPQESLPGILPKDSCERWQASLQYIKAEVHQKVRMLPRRERLPAQLERIGRLNRALQEAIQLTEELKKEK